MRIALNRHMGSGITADELVHLVTQRDKSAERQLCLTYYESTLKFVRTVVRDEAAAEDLTHETLLTVLLNLREGKVRQAQFLNRYVKQTAHYLVIAWYRRKGNQAHESIDEIPIAGTEVSVEDAVFNSERRELVEQLIASMSVARDRDILLRHSIRDEDKSVICKEKGLSSQDFDRIISRARNRCRDLVTRIHDYPQTSLMGRGF